jgi:hypothetical protein
MRQQNTVPLDFIDHLIFTSPNLESGMDYIESKLGVRPIIGGRHPKFGTQNALLSLGPKIYLEVIAPDPQSKLRNEKVLFDNIYKNGIQLSTWVMHTDKIDTIAAVSKKGGLDVGTVSPGSRIKPDGTEISWKASNPFAFHCGGAIPFLIDWGESMHPAAELPRGGELLSFQIKHPNPVTVSAYLKNLGLDVLVSKSPNIQLIANVQTPKGVVLLQ